MKRSDGIHRGTARYQGRCRACGLAITPGDRLVSTGHKLNYHEACYDRAFPKAEPAPAPAPAPSPRWGDHVEPERRTYSSLEVTCGDGTRYALLGVDGQPGWSPTLLVSDSDRGGADTFLPVRWSTVKRQHLWACAEQAFPDVKGTYWRKATNEVLRHALTSGVLPDLIRDWIDRDLLLPGSQPAPQGDGHGTPAPIDVEALDARIREALASLHEAYQADVAAAVEAALAARQALRIELKTPRGVAVIDGAHHVVPNVLKAISQRLHVYLYGPAGTGKSTIALQVAEALGLAFDSISLSPDTDSSALLGFVSVTSGEYVDTSFHRLYRDGGVFLIDEVDNCDGSILAVLNAALESFCTFPSVGLVKRHPDFVCIVAGNTWGNGPDSTFIGRAPLDAATLSRFVSIHVPIDERIEDAAALRGIEDQEAGRDWVRRVRVARANVERAGLQVVVSPRASIQGCKLLQSGYTLPEAAQAVIVRGLDSSTAATVLQGVL